MLAHRHREALNGLRKLVSLTSYARVYCVVAAYHDVAHDHGRPPPVHIPLGALEIQIPAAERSAAVNDLLWDLSFDQEPVVMLSSDDREEYLRAILYRGQVRPDPTPTTV